MICDKCENNHDDACKVAEINLVRDPCGRVITCSRYKKKEKNYYDPAPTSLNISARICELCEAIKGYVGYSDTYEKIRLCAYEIICMNQVNKTMHYLSKRSATIENEKEDSGHE